MVRCFHIKRELVGGFKNSPTLIEYAINRQRIVEMNIDIVSGIHIKDTFILIKCDGSNGGIATKELECGKMLAHSKGAPWGALKIAPPL